MSSTLVVSQTCHYCGEKAKTEDHVVPQSLLPKPLARLPYWFRSQFTVPACKPCNGAKEDFRSDCNCQQCTWVWNVALATWVDPAYEPPRIVVAEARRQLEATQRRNFHRRKMAEKGAIRR